MRHTITCDLEHLGAAQQLLTDEVAKFSKYTRVGWGWGFGNYRTGPRFFVRRLKDGLSIIQMKEPSRHDQ